MFSERLVPYVITLNNLIGKINRTKKRQKRKVKKWEGKAKEGLEGAQTQKVRRKTKFEEKKEGKKEKIRFLSKRKRKCCPSRVSGMKSELRKSTWEKSEKKCKGTEKYQTSYLKQLSYESCKCEVSHKFC